MPRGHAAPPPWPLVVFARSTRRKGAFTTYVVVLIRGSATYTGNGSSRAVVNGTHAVRSADEGLEVTMDHQTPRRTSATGSPTRASVFAEQGGTSWRAYAAAVTQELL